MRRFHSLPFALAAVLALAACGDQITQPATGKPEAARPAEQPQKYLLPTNVGATMAPGGPYNLRTGPGTGYALAGTVAGGSGITISCTSSGENVVGYYATSVVWNRLTSGAWVADANVYTGTDRAAARPCIRDDYPLKYASTSGVDPWNFYNRQCTSFAAFRVNWNGTRTGQTFTNMYLGRNFGDAHTWDDAARATGVAVYSTPAVGRIAQWNQNVGGASPWGHVAYVAAVYSSTDILIEEYNATPYAYSTRRITASSGYWPSNFIDF
jgi:surface antigen/predicted small lipoprotein YifL